MQKGTFLSSLEHKVSLFNSTYDMLKIFLPVIADRGHFSVFGAESKLTIFTPIR